MKISSVATIISFASILPLVLWGAPHAFFFVRTNISMIGPSFIVLLVTALLLLYANQGRIIWIGQRRNEQFHQLFSPVDVLTQAGMEIIRVNTHVGVFFASVRPRATSPTLIFFHGNGDQLGIGPVYLGPIFANQGFNFLAVEYPGYGISGGENPNERTVLAAAEAVILRMESDHGVNRDSEILVGQSIGTGVAVALAERGYGCKLVLISPFTCLREMASIQHFTLAFLLRYFPFFLCDKLDNLGSAAAIKIPTLILHGKNDEVVPYSQGERLAKEFPSCRFVQLRRASHCNVFDTNRIFEEIISFTRDV